MREQFDKKLVNKIKSSLSEKEEIFDASEWDKFSKIYFKKEAKPMLFWIKWASGIAATILLGITLNSLFTPIQQTTNQTPNLITLKEEDKPEEKNTAISEEIHSPIDLPDTDQSKNKDLNEDFGQKNNTSNKAPHLSKTTATKKDALEEDTYLAEKTKSTLLPDQKPAGNSNFLNTPKTSSELIGKSESEQMTQEEAIVQIEEWKSEKAIALEENEVEKNSFGKEPIKLGVLVAPQTISNSTQSINMGAGLMSEFSISKKLKFDVGLAYARQNISPNSNSSPMLASNPNAMENFDMKIASFTGNVINSSRELSFGQLEIPLNLKYKVFEKKESDLYLISGVSNMVYLNQQDVTTFSTANIATTNFANSQQAVETITQTLEPDSQESGIDTGRMLNFGVGFEQNLKNGTFLSIEPFYKIALGNQTFTNQQFSIGGINLRMNFQLKNKKNNND
ncbi:hypothetical protein [Aquiflexum gelatinilyticum]|uniref:Outer membrane protein beta-barrel domain-containing protein n=1 Tax=Aquiflexum gelatinilyticum TaxID=2961943 RepID=A0A9X2P6K2_9BACT|nr:hypothetical protein [Aquiflexum gelatinilyticum]MCR9017096.1 hypothetical protein [Aquiflexum gelatinilyticum]